MAKIRLDELVRRRTGKSLSRARGLIHMGQVSMMAGDPLKHPGERVDEAVELVIRAGRKYVSRGGAKLEAALDHFEVDVTDAVALDAGASTGGFTDCLLQRGAAKVYAVDVGYGQLDWTLRQDPRVVVLERTNVRQLQPADLEEGPTFFTADCSFISLAQVLRPVRALLAKEAEGIALIKPQFEARREQVEPGGVVRDPRVHEEVVANTLAALRELGFDAGGVIPSPLLGPAGNKEFLAHLHTPR